MGLTHSMQEGRKGSRAPLRRPKDPAVAWQGAAAGRVGFGRRTKRWSSTCMEQ